MTLHLGVPQQAVTPLSEPFSITEQLQRQNNIPAGALIIPPCQGSGEITSSPAEGRANRCANKGKRPEIKLAPPRPECALRADKKRATKVMRGWLLCGPGNKR